MGEDNIKAVIEALLFCSEKPLLIEQIKKAMDNLDASLIRNSLEELKTEYEKSNRGIRLYEVAGGFRMIAAPEFSTFLKRMYKTSLHTDRLSKPALETLAIIAYKQPLIKSEIEILRNVNVDGVMQTLLEKNLIRISGRKKAPGRPLVYATTRQFLEYFGLKGLEELPKIENFPVPEGENPAQLEPQKKEEQNEPEKSTQTN